MKCLLLATDVIDCQVQKLNNIKVCIQKFTHVLKCKPEDVNVNVWLLHGWSTDHLVEMFPLFDKILLQLGDVMNPAADAPAASPRSSSLLGWGQDCWLANVVTEIGAMKSGVSRVNCCMVFTRPMCTSVVLSAKVTFRPLTALINMTETDIFCRRYFKINTFTVNGYFLTKFCNSFKDLFRIQWTLDVRCVVIWHFYPILSVVYFFPGHIEVSSCYLYWPISHNPTYGQTPLSLLFFGIL